MGRVQGRHYLCAGKMHTSIYYVTLSVYGSNCYLCIFLFDIIICLCRKMQQCMYGSTFHDLGILNPWKLMSSSCATLNDPCTAGSSLMDSCTTLHESFIFCISPQFKSSPGALLAAISLFSEQIANHHLKTQTKS